MTRKANKKKYKKFARATKVEVSDKATVDSEGPSTATGSDPKDSVHTKHKAGDNNKKMQPPRKPTASGSVHVPRDRPRGVIDMSSFPHLISAIIDFAPHASLLRLRTSCTRLRDAVDKKMFKHVAVVLNKKLPGKGMAATQPIQLLPIEELHCPQAPFHRLPILYYAPLELEALKAPKESKIISCDWRRDGRFQQAAKMSRDRQLELVSLIDFYDMPHKVLMVNDSQIDSLEIRQRFLQPRILRRVASFHHEIWDIIPNPPHTVVDFVLKESHPLPFEIEVRGATRHVVNILWSKDYPDFTFPFLPRIFWDRSVKEVVIVIAEHPGAARVTLPLTPNVMEMSDIREPLPPISREATVPSMLLFRLTKQLMLFGLRGGSIEFVGIESLPPTMVFRPQGNVQPHLPRIGIPDMEPRQRVEHFAASLVGTMFHGCPQFIGAIGQEIAEGLINRRDVMKNMITFRDRLKFTTLATWLATAAAEERTWPEGQGILNTRGPLPERDPAGNCDLCGHQNFAHMEEDNNSRMCAETVLPMFDI